MPGLLLITTDSDLHDELVQTLAGSDWSIEWYRRSSIDVDNVERRVVVIDSAHPESTTWKPKIGTPLLLLVQPDQLTDAIQTGHNDFFVRPLKGPELAARLERLDTRPPLNSQRQDYADLFASAATGIVVMSRSGSVLFCNPRGYEIVGHREETIERGDLGQVVAPEELPRVQNILTGFPRGEYPRGVDIKLVRRDGTEIVCNASFSPLARSEDYTVVSFEDVTDQRETEEELIKTMEFLESLIDASVDAIIATDMDRKIVLFNPSAERISGHHVSDVLGTLKLEDLLGNASAELVMQRLLSEEYGGEGRLEPIMLDLRDVVGTAIPVQLSASLIYEHGQPSAIELIFQDLRERIRVEVRLAEAQKKLAFTEKQAVLAELAGTAAHELNQPLTSMMAYAELLLRRSEPDSQGAKAAQVLIKEAERMAEIVRKIGKITRYETTSYVGQQKIFDLDKATDPPSPPETAEKG